MRHGDAPGELYLSKCVRHLLLVLRQGSDRSVAFVALGKLALVAPRHVSPHLDVITQQIRDSTNLRSSRKAFCVEAVICVGMLTRALGVVVENNISDIFDFLFNGGLSKPLVLSLVDIVKKLPGFTERVHLKLLNAISMTLISEPYSGYDLEPIGSAGFSVPTGSDPTTNIVLALNTLSTFDFGPEALMHFTQNSVLELLEDEVESLRREAATTCARMIRRVISCITPRSFYSRQVADAVGRLLRATAPHIHTQAGVSIVLGSGAEVFI